MQFMMLTLKRHIQTQDATFFMAAPLHQVKTFCMSYSPFISSHYMRHAMQYFQDRFGYSETSVFAMWVLLHMSKDSYFDAASVQWTFHPGIWPKILIARFTHLFFLDLSATSFGLPQWIRIFCQTAVSRMNLQAQNLTCLKVWIKRFLGLNNIWPHNVSLWCWTHRRHLQSKYQLGGDIYKAGSR